MIYTTQQEQRALDRILRDIDAMESRERELDAVESADERLDAGRPAAWDQDAQFDTEKRMR